MDNMLAPLLKMLAGLSNLTLSRKNRNKEFLEITLNPVMEEMNMVHKNYLSSFVKYSEMIKTTTKAIDKNHPIFFELRMDSILSSDSRERLYSFYDSANDDILKEFLSAIATYFRFSEIVDVEPRKLPIHFLPTSEIDIRHLGDAGFVGNRERLILSNELSNLDINVSRKATYLAIGGYSNLSKLFNSTSDDKFSSIPEVVINIPPRTITSIQKKKKKRKKDKPKKPSALSDKERAEILIIINSHIQHLQTEYRKVVDCYNSIKKELLS
jgi:hypothetical protein